MLRQRTAIVAVVSAVVLTAACENGPTGPLAPESVGRASLQADQVCAGQPDRVGTESGDFIWGSNQDDKIVGNGGNDRIYAFGGADCLVGGTGDDQLHGGAGDDRLIGGPGNDILDVGGSGAKVAIGGDGDDIIHVAYAQYGETTSEVIAGAGDDRIYADDDSADTIRCGDGYDTVDADALDVLEDCEVVY